MTICAYRYTEGICLRYFLYLYLVDIIYIV